jgi:pSer/pThr/pTyr-binding forkhead associated (FHA) protein/outer membrane biosynthesis protein TonB
LKARVKEQVQFELKRYQDGTLAQSYAINRKKLIVGRAPHCDIVIDDPHISHYHAYLIIDENGGKVMDLDSDNGVYLNGQRTQSSYFAPGDTLQFGHLQFSVEETITEEITIDDQDQGKVVKLDNIPLENLPTDLPPLPGLVVIDGEYCDITFDEDDYRPVDAIPALELYDFSDSYIDYEEETPEKNTAVAKSQTGSTVEVIVMSNGHVLSVDYFQVKNKVYYACSKAGVRNSVHIPFLEGKDRVPLLKIRNGQVNISSLPDFEIRSLERGEIKAKGEGSTIPVEQDDQISLEQGTLQVFVRLTDAPPRLISAPFFGRDRQFQIKAAQYFSVIMGLFLLLLLVDTSIPEPPKKISVIYRKMIKAEKVSDKKSKQNADKKDTLTGIKQENQKKPEPKMAKKKTSKSKPKPKKAKKPTPKPKVAQKSAPVKAVKKKAPPVKTYQFKMKSGLTSMFNNAKKVAPSKVVNNAASATTASSMASTSNDYSKDLNNDAPSEVGTLGKDFNGQYDRSTGSKGMASKSGVDTAHMGSKTVLLGSMDPELLRKILREYLPQFRHCYQKELERNEAAKGVVDLNFRISANGKVSNIKVSGKKARITSQGAGCMAGVLNLIKFPKPKGGGVVDVRQPLNFFSEKQKY